MAALVIAIITLVLVVIAILSSIILTILTLVRAHRNGDLSRSGPVSWVKAASCLVSFWFILSIISIVVSFFSDDRWGASYQSSLSIAIQQMPIIGGVFFTVALASVLMSQVEIALALKRLSTMEGEALDKTRVPKLFSMVLYVVLVLLALGRFAANEYYVLGGSTLDHFSDAYLAAAVLNMIILGIMAISAIATLVYAIRLSRVSTLPTVWRLLVALCAVTVARSIYQAIIAGIIDLGYWSIPQPLYLNILSALFEQWTLVVGLGLAYAIVTKKQGGLYVGSATLGKLEQDSHGVGHYTRV